MRDYYVVVMKLASGKEMTSSLMLLADAEALCCELNNSDSVSSIVFVCTK